MNPSPMEPPMIEDNDSLPHHRVRLAGGVVAWVNCEPPSGGDCDGPDEDPLDAAREALAGVLALDGTETGEEQDAAFARAEAVLGGAS